MPARLRVAPLTLCLAAVAPVGAAAVEIATDSDPGTAHYVPVTGERRVAVILVNFTDNTDEPGTPEQVQATFDGPINDYFYEASYQSVFLTTDVYGWWTLPYTSERCWDNEAGIVASEISEEAAQRNVDLSGYDHLVYVFNQNYGGLCLTNHGTISPGGRGTVWRAWTGGSKTAGTESDLDQSGGIKSIVHEIGHNLGLHHANELLCGTDILATDCTLRHYGDPYDAMGAGYAGHYNAFHKERLGWLGHGAASANRIDTVVASGIYTLGPYASPGGVKALKIRRGAGVSGTDYLYVEYRQPQGWDNLFPRPAVYEGLLLHLGNDAEADSSRLLDMSPAEAFDHALPPGQVFRDPVAMLDIELLAATPTEATVQVTIWGDAIPPEVRFLTPDDGAVMAKGAAVTLRAAATDETAINRVEFLLDGNAVCASTVAQTDGVYSCEFTAPKGKSRSLVLEAVAVDESGNSASAAVVVHTGDTKTRGKR